MCERAWGIFEGDVTGGERVRMDENNLGTMGFDDEG